MSISLLILIAGMASAADKVTPAPTAPTPAPKIDVQVLKGGAPAPTGSEFELHGEVRPPINKKYRELFFKRVSMDDDVAKMDEVEKNQLIYRMREWDAEKLHKFYPAISKDTFKEALITLKKAKS